MSALYQFLLSQYVYSFLSVALALDWLWYLCLPGEVLYIFNTELLIVLVMKQKENAAFTKQNKNIQI